MPCSSLSSPSPSPALTCLAPAKVNLSLEILRRRPDGYHDIASVMQAVDLADELVFERAGDLTLECNWPELAGPDNLVLLAAERLRAVAGLECGARITLTKRVPVGAGLGGGSSDAAATLLALNHFWEAGLPPEALRDIAAALGSDVPFFLTGGCALVEGRGERLTPLPPLAGAWLVLLKPPFGISTRQVYHALIAGDFGDGGATGRLVERLRAGGPVGPALLVNGMERAAFCLFPEMARYRDLMTAAGAPEARMSGSGSAQFALFARQAEAAAVHARLAAQGFDAYLVSPLPAWG